jgi:hypothetical protein
MIVFGTGVENIIILYKNSNLLTAAVTLSLEI